MTYHIVAGEEMKKLLKDRIDSIPFNEDMSKGGYTHEPFSYGFISERSAVHGVTLDAYKSNMKEFFALINKLDKEDVIHLYFGDDAVCRANCKLLIDYFKNKVSESYLHLMNEYEGIELSIKKIQ